MGSEPLRVALLVETSSSYGRDLLAGINHYSNLHGPWSFYVEPASLDALPPSLDGWGAAGIIARSHTPQQARRIASMNLPTVNLDEAGGDRFPRGVANDDRAIGTLAAQHLLDCGFEHYGFCGWSPAVASAENWERPRREAFEKTVRAAGGGTTVYAWPAREVERAWAREQAHLIRWLEESPKPLGVMASDDQRGRHVLVAAMAAGLRVPHDVAVIGVDNDRLLCEMSTPSLSSVALRVERVGFEAARLLDQQMKGQPPQDRTLVIEPDGIVARQSTDVLAMKNQQLVAAIRYMRENAHRGIRVQDVLKVVSMSRKTLETGCRRALGRTPHAEIQRVRLDRIKQLLLHTDWPLKKIAEASGFSYAEHMHAIFRRETGLTPKQYRTARRGP
ncbi:MAG: DNA-binding transcriptional regulator [Phycisphaeraceae bacterium]|nr:DNA-binding transcriptional regulator [Phycisphaeraceae bacterium]